MPCRVADDLKGGGELPLAAVDDDEIGQLFLGQTYIAARRHFAHGEEVVRLALRAADLKAAIVRFLRCAILKDDHRGDGLLPLIVRDIEALHAPRRMLQPEVSPEFLHGTKRLLIQETAPRLLVCEEFCGVARRHLHNIVLRAALRCEEGDLAAPLACGKPCLDGRLRRCVNRTRQQHLTRDKGRLIVVLLQESAQDIRITLLLAATQEKVLAPDHLAAADEEDLHADARRRARHADGILIACPCHDVLSLRRRAHGTQLIAEPCRRLKVIRLCRRIHALLQFALDVIRPALKEEEHGANHGTVVLRLHLADAWGKAAFDVILETGTLGHRAAGAQRKKTPQEL